MWRFVQAAVAELLAAQAAAQHTHDRTAQAQEEGVEDLLQWLAATEAQVAAAQADEVCTRAPLLLLYIATCPPTIATCLPPDGLWAHLAGLGSHIACPAAQACFARDTVDFDRPGRRSGTQQIPAYVVRALCRRQPWAQDAWVKSWTGGWRVIAVISILPALFVHRFLQPWGCKLALLDAFSRIGYCSAAIEWQ